MNNIYSHLIMKNNSLCITKSTGIIATLKIGISEIQGLNDVHSGELILSSSEKGSLFFISKIV